eukprot:TRINITY_DN1078_c0_g1_i3.p1 TRINITY_DN1078_c0_g1~~TRINITY_DN1078_c0_g1_i3.p1  ORF type:complete len:607 (+),score=90.48 TRINITY_DN1078_c0_g1_i3:88-1821(+)
MAAALRCGLVTILVFFALWNGSKLLFYWEKKPFTSVDYNATHCEESVTSAEGFDKNCAGIPTQFNLYRGLDLWESSYKVKADQNSFLFPHCAMGVCLDVLMAFAIIFGSVNLYHRSKIFFPIAFIFAIHILPVADGMPNSLANGAPINQTLAICIMIACCVGWYGMRQDFVRNGGEPPMDKHAGKLILYAWIAIGVLVNIAPIGEWGMILSSLGSKKEITGRDMPHPESGTDFYSRLNIPWIGKCAGAFVCFTTFMYAFDNYAVWRGESWRSPFNKDGPALFQLMMNPYPKTGDMFHQRPERWLEATGECFVLCIAASWFITSIFNPGIYKENILRSIVGYNNLCVGFDSPPARYVAMPLLVCQAVLASRYCYLDTLRLKATRQYLTGKQYWFGYCINTFFSVWMMCFPMLLVITAEFDSWSSTKIHLYLFMGTLFVMWLMIAGNVYEAESEDIDFGTRVWFGLFTAHTLLLPVVGIMDVLAFHPELPADKIYTIRYEHPHPPVPWPITAYLDYGWFLLLLLTVIFLPDAPPVRTVFNVDLAEKYGIAGEKDEMNVMHKEFGSEDVEDSSDEDGICP